MANDIFISYSRKDSHVVHQFVQHFRDAGFDVWIDENGIESGEAFKKVITQAIMESQVFVFFSSEASNKSEWTAKEVGIASHLHKHIIPVKLDNSSYNLEIMFDLINIDFIDYTIAEKQEGMMEKLISSIYRITGKDPFADNTVPEDELTEFQVPDVDVDVPDLDLPEIDYTEDEEEYSDDIQDIVLPDIELPDMEEPDLMPEEADSAETTGYKVRMNSAGAAKLAALKVIKDAFGFSLAEAKNLVDNTPVTFDKILDKRSAERLILDIADCGGSADLIPCGEGGKLIADSSSARIRLVSSGTAKLQLTKIIKEMLNVSLGAAFDYVNNTPVTIDVLINTEMAKQIKAEIDHLGGKAEIV